LERRIEIGKKTLRHRKFASQVASRIAAVDFSTAVVVSIRLQALRRLEA
jgi:hypothetical protein